MRSGGSDFSTAREHNAAASFTIAVAILPGCARSHVRVFELFIFAGWRRRTMCTWFCVLRSIKLAKASD